MSEFFAKIGDFFVDTWNNNPQYIWIAAAVLVVLILVIVICCVVSSKRKKAKKAAAETAESQPQIAAEQTPAPVQADDPAETAAAPATVEEDSAETAAAQETAAAPAETAEEEETAEEPVAEEAEESESAAATAEKEQPSGKKEENTVKEQKPAPAKAAAKKPASSAAGAPKSAKNPSDHSAVYHVTRRKEDGKWQVKYAKGAKALKLFDTQAEAAAYARKIADNRGGSVVVHKVTGQIRKVKEKIGGDEEKE